MNRLLFADTVQEELDVTLMNHGLDPSGYGDQSHQLLAQLELVEFREKYPRDLSVGQRQRLAMAALMITEPSLILMDEPTRGLDLMLKVELTKLLQGWLEAGKGILLVTHDSWLAEIVADRILFLSDGKLVEMPEDRTEDRSEKFPFPSVSIQ